MDRDTEMRRTILLIAVDLVTKRKLIEHISTKHFFILHDCSKDYVSKSAHNLFICDRFFSYF